MSALLNTRAIFAAARLALFYSAFVILEILVLIVLMHDGVPSLSDFGEMASSLSIPFAGAFLLLAVARRWGLVALWTILGAFWILVTFVSGSWHYPIDFPRLFLPWSIFALPLWIIGQVGIARISSQRISTSMALLICWAALLLSIQFFGLPRTEFVHPHRYGIADLLAWIWAPMPLILSAFAIRHVWRGTAKPVAA